MLEPQKDIRPIVGLIPAGGGAERLGPLPCSKEVYKVDTVIFEEGFCLDIGTPNDLGRAIQIHESFF